MDSLSKEYKESAIDNIQVEVERGIQCEMVKMHYPDTSILSCEMKALIIVIAPYLFDAQHPEQNFAEIHDFNIGNLYALR